MPSARRSLRPEKPTVGRLFASVLLLLVATNARAEGPLSEEDAVRAGLGQPAVGARARAQSDLAQADATAEGIWPNPTLTYSREQTPDGASASAEDFLWVEQALDLSGRRGLREDAAEARVRGATHAAVAARLDLEREIRARFHELLRRQRRAEAVAAWIAPMERIAESVRRREAAGDVSGYDRRRLDREQASARARLEVEIAGRERTWASLVAVTGGGGGLGAPEGWPRVSGDLLPQTSPPPVPRLLGRVPGRPELRALSSEAEAGDVERRAAGRWWIPALTLGGGLKRVDAGGDSLIGYILLASLSLPVFDRHQDEAQRGSARARLARAHSTLARTRAVGEIRGRHAEATRLAEAARRFREEAVSTSSELVQTADAAYQAGEIGILELLDAHRSALDAELEALDLAMSARVARIALDRATAGGSR